MMTNGNLGFSCLLPGATCGYHKLVAVEILEEFARPRRQKVGELRG
jgi:hypothetical protein